jgi:uncharacterized protein
VRDPATIRMLPDGHRLHLNDGPIDRIVGADALPAEIQSAYEAAARRFVTVLDELCEELPILRSRQTADSALPSGPIARCMVAAVSPYRNRCFITPMAAVAGAVAEAVLTAMTKAAQLRRAYVNNGGDIALHLSGGQSYRVGLVERPETPSLFGSAEISATMEICGVATSGWRGRSFSLGIADAVTVLAETAAQADSAATIIANAVDLPNHPAIVRIPARKLAPDSDLLDLPVTRAVGPLRPQEIAQALEAGAAVAEAIRSTGLVHSAALCLRDQVRIVSSLCRDGLLRPSATAPIRRPTDTTSMAIPNEVAADLRSREPKTLRVIPSEATKALPCRVQGEPSCQK